MTAFAFIDINFSPELSLIKAVIRELNGDLDVPGYDEELLKVLTSSAKETDAVLNDYGKLSQHSIASTFAGIIHSSFNRTCRRPLSNTATDQHLRHAEPR